MGVQAVNKGAAWASLMVQTTVCSNNRVSTGSVQGARGVGGGGGERGLRAWPGGCEVAFLGGGGNPRHAGLQECVLQWHIYRWRAQAGFQHVHAGSRRRAAACNSEVKQACPRAF